MFVRIGDSHVRAGTTRAALLAVMLIASGGVVHAQQKPPQVQTIPLAPEPSASALKVAREILELMQTDAVFAPMVPGVIERVRAMILQTNPAVRKDLDEVSANLRKVYAQRTTDLMN